MLVPSSDPLPERSLYSHKTHAEDSNERYLLAQTHLEAPDLHHVRSMLDNIRIKTVDRVQDEQLVGVSKRS